jgi:hypothetical protein
VHTKKHRLSTHEKSKRHDHLSSGGFRSHFFMKHSLRIQNSAQQHWEVLSETMNQGTENSDGGKSFE